MLPVAIALIIGSAHLLPKKRLPPFLFFHTALSLSIRHQRRQETAITPDSPLHLCILFSCGLGFSLLIYLYPIAKIIIQQAAKSHNAVAYHRSSTTSCPFIPSPSTSSVWSSPILEKANCHLSLSLSSLLDCQQAPLFPQLLADC